MTAGLVRDSRCPLRRRRWRGLRRGSSRSSSDGSGEWGIVSFCGGPVRSGDRDGGALGGTGTGRRARRTTTGAATRIASRRARGFRDGHDRGEEGHHAGRDGGAPGSRARCAPWPFGAERLAAPAGLDVKNVWLAPSASDFSGFSVCANVSGLGVLVFPGQDGAFARTDPHKDHGVGRHFLVRMSARRSTVRPSFQSTHRQRRPEGFPSGRSLLIRPTALPPTRRAARFAAPPR